MIEEKETLKERLVAIMKYNKKSKSIILMSIVLLIAVISGAVVLGASIGKTNQDVTYFSTDYRVSLEYPSDWDLNPAYNEKYEGNDGFFQLSAVSGDGRSIDELVELDAFHHLMPYGSNPQITKLKIQDQEARLILPSSDQIEEWNNQAGFIIKYPKAVKIGDSLYNYLVLWADKEHIEQIIQTISFPDKYNP